MLALFGGDFDGLVGVFVLVAVFGVDLLEVLAVEEVREHDS